MRGTDIYEITAIILMFKNKRYFFLGIAVIVLSCMTYGNYLFGVEYPLLIMSLINIFVYAWYMYLYVVSDRNKETSLLNMNGE